MTQANRSERLTEVLPTAFRRDAPDGLSHEALFDELVDALTACGMWLCVARRQARSRPAQGPLSLDDVLTKAADQHQRASEAVHLIRDRLGHRGAQPPESVLPLLITGRIGLPSGRPALPGRQAADAPNATMAGDRLG